MPFYQVNMVWKLHRMGWTEQYYRQAEGHVQAADLGGEAGLRAWMDLRAAGVQLQALRVIEQGGLEPMYLRLFNLPAVGQMGAPDITSTAAVVSWEMGESGSREMWLRGLPDLAVQRFRDTGLDNPHPQWQQLYHRWRDAVLEFQLRGRRMRVTPWHDVMLLALGAPDSGTVLLHTTPDMGPLKGQQVYFGGAPRQHNSPVRYDHALLVVDDLGPGQYLLSAPWPGQRAPIVGFDGWRVRHLSYDYPLLTAVDLVALRKHDTARAYQPASWFPQRRIDVPIHPCGRVVDVVRQPETVAMRFFRGDPGRFDRVQWYVVEDPARPVVPWPHVFYSKAWALDTPPMILGEDPVLRQPSFEKDPVGLKGVGICGSMEQWARGAMPDDPVRPQRVYTGQPCCCGPGIMTRRAGSVAGAVLAAGPALVMTAGNGAGLSLEGWRWMDLSTGGTGAVEIIAGPALTLSLGGSQGLELSSGALLNFTGGSSDGLQLASGETADLNAGASSGASPDGATSQDLTAGATGGAESERGTAEDVSGGGTAGGEAVEEPQEEPGSSCATALSVTVGETYGPFTMDPSEGHWFSLGAVTGLHSFRLTVTDLSGPFAGGLLSTRDGTACNDLTLVDQHFILGNGDYCFETTFAGPLSWFDLLNSAFGNLTYTLRVEEGACP